MQIYAANFRDRTLEPNSIYTITSTTGQHKGTTNPPADTAFPLPYQDTFDHYPNGSTTPQYFIEQNGSYETRPCEGGRKGQCLTQIVNTSPIVWTYGATADLLGTASIIGDKRWRDYRVSSDVLLQELGYARVLGRVSRVTLDGQISGYQLYVYDSGKWELRTSTKGGVLASGNAPIGWICQNWVTFLESQDEEGKSRRPIRSVSVIKGSRRWFAGQRASF